MNDQLESDLREALRARAAHVPPAAAARLTGLDYRPRTRRLHPPVAIGAVAMAAAAGILTVVISLGAGASNAFAGWTPAPTAPARGQLAAAASACKQSQSPVAGLPLAVADTRGPFTFSIYADGTSTAICINGPTFRSVSESASSAAVSVAADRIVLSSTHLSSRDGQMFGFALGRAGADVSAVTLVLDDGTQVQATVENGWFLAWWPSAHRPQSAQLTTPAGTSTQKFDLPWPNPCSASSNCSVDSSSGGGSGTGSGRASGFSQSGSQ